MNNRQIVNLCLGAILILPVPTFAQSQASAANSSDILSASFSGVTSVNGDVGRLTLTAKDQASLVKTVTVGPGLNNVASKSQIASSFASTSPPPTGSISAVPKTLNLRAGQLGTTTLYWTWSQPYNYFTFGCVYVSVDGGVPSVMDCEHPNNNYATVASWIQGGHQYQFEIILQDAPCNGCYPSPPGVVASTLVTGILVN